MGAKNDTGKLKRAFSPEGDRDPVELADLIDGPALQKLLEDFYSVAHIPMSIVDVHGRVLAGVGLQDICSRFHRKQSETFGLCLEDDEIHAAGRQYRLYKCKNNLRLAATPIKVAGRRLGNLFMGQFFFDEETVDLETFRAQARECGFDEEEYLAALDRVPRLSREAVDRGMRIFLKLADMLSRLGYSNIKLVHLLTERERLTDSLRKSEERLKRAQQIAQVGSWELDLTKNELTWSDEAHRIFGLEPQEFDATYEAFLERVHPDDRKAVDDAYVESLHEGRDAYEIDHRVVRKSTGETRYIHEKCEHFRDAAGRVVYSVGMVQDITERKRAEEMLSAERNFLNAVLDTAGALVIVLDREGRIVRFNKACEKKTGYTSAEAEGRVLWDLLLTEDEKPGVMEVFRRLEAGQFPLEYENHWIARNGELVLISWSNTALLDRKGMVDYIIGTGVDITERKRAEEALRKAHDDLELRVEARTLELQSYMKRLQESNRALKDFVSIASHDLQEPLRKVRMFGQRLKEKFSPALGAHGRDYVERMQAASERMQNLIDALLDYSRVTTRAQPNAPVNLNDLVGEVLLDLEARVEETKGRVEVESLPTIEADPNQMRQLFQNLIGNALKFHGEEYPVVSVHGLPCSDGVCRIQVSDNGIGFDEKKLERLFAPFQRLHGKGSPYKGTGMGLAICKKIVERHGGNITAKSSPGTGSTFIIDLPVEQDRPE